MRKSSDLSSLHATLTLREKQIRIVLSARQGE